VDPTVDLVPLTKLVDYPALLLAGPRLPVRSLTELLAHPRTAAGQLDYGSGGNGSAPHLAMELFADVAGIRMNHIGYRGMAQAMTDLVGGRIDLAISVVPTVRPMLGAPGLNVLAVATSGARVPAVAQVPTAKEQGVDYVLGFWFGLMAPRGMDPALAVRIQQEVAAVIQAPDVRARLEEQGGIVGGSDPAAFRAEVARDMRLWNRLVPEKAITL
jgi:tripartite-type tricarboxylate transporter receptor subunit TctC